MELITNKYASRQSGNKIDVSAESLKLNNNQSACFFNQYQQFATNLLSAMQNDSVVLMLMIMLAIMSPDRPGSLRYRDAIGVSLLGALQQGETGGPPPHMTPHFKI